MNANIQNKEKPIVWSVAGSDCSGLAGQVADIRAIEALGAHPCMVTTAVTAQNNQQLIALNPLSKEQITSQFDALKDALPAKAIKVGLLPTLGAVEALAEFIEGYTGTVVLDPVIASSAGDLLVEESAIAAIKKLLAKVSLVTPNIPELELLTESKVTNASELKLAAKKLLSQGVKNLLVKGGHAIGSLESTELAQDFFINHQESFYLTSQKLVAKNNRGTGCVLAAGIAAALALDYSLKDALVIGKMLLNQGLENGYDLAGQKGPLQPMNWPSESRFMPKLTASEKVSNFQFPSCDEKPLGLYPVVDSAKWIARLLPLGISTIQLRVKDLTGDELEQEIKTAVEISEKYQARLFINDHWQLAIKHGAYGVHLGQEDLDIADIAAIHDAGLRLGISTHCYYEVARAHAIKPSYLACGPVYHTDSKPMSWIPHGIPNLDYWNRCMKQYPWVAIGGINLERLLDVAQTGVSGIAMISAITQADKPEKIAKQMLTIIDQTEPR